MDEQPPARRRRLARSTAIFALATGLSRILGLVREIVARYYFGTVGPINAFTVAFQIPNTVRALVADAALSSAFVPVFSELLVKGERKRAWRVASSLFWLDAARPRRPDGAVHPHRAVDHGRVRLRRQCSPSGSRASCSRSSCCSACRESCVGILNSYDHFTVPALTPVFWNIAIIVGLVIGVPRANGISAELYVYAFSILIATVIQFLLPLPWLRGRDGQLQVVIDWRDPAVRQTLRADGPDHDRPRADQLQRGRRHVLRLAPDRPLPGAERDQRGVPPLHAPAGDVLGRGRDGALPVARAARGRGDFDGFRRTVATGLRQIAFLLVPASVLCAVLAEPIVRLVYQRGEFTPRQTPVVAASLAAFALGLVFNGSC